MSAVQTVQVWHSHADDNGNPYYRAIPSNQLIIHIDGAWHTAIDDGCWEEPIAPIREGAYNIEIVDRPEALT